MRSYYSAAKFSTFFVKKHPAFEISHIDQQQCEIVGILFEREPSRWLQDKICLEVVSETRQLSNGLARFLLFLSKVKG